MIDEIQARKDIEEGARADRLLKEIGIYFDQAEAHIVSKFKAAPIRDTEGIVRAKDLLHALTLVRRAMEDAIRNGQLAEKALEEKRRGVQFLGDVWPSRRPRRP